VTESRLTQQGIYEGYIKLSVRTREMERSVAGTVFSDGRPRLIQVKGIDVNGEFAPHMLYVTNEDKPGTIGRLGMLLGDAGINIASFALGRVAPGSDAIALVEVDSAVSPDVLKAIAKLPLVRQARALNF
jgi:D-3-phosphoglycerate dehydrogenase